MNTEDKKKQLEKRKNEISSEVLNKKAEIKKINAELDKLKKINCEYVETNLKNIQSEISLLIEEYNKTAIKEKVPIRAAIVFVDQSIPEECLEDYTPEELEEHSVFDIDRDSWCSISMRPEDMEEMFFERGWFPSSFC